ncbi:MAG: hypothetical protein M3171_05980 [Actinomycetota bacterium]|nr:hypothetical protein [Actinomycetota bacterium]
MIAISPRRQATVEGYVAVGVTDVLFIGQGATRRPSPTVWLTAYPACASSAHPMHAARELTAAGPS